MRAALVLATVAACVVVLCVCHQLHDAEPCATNGRSLMTMRPNADEADESSVANAFVNAMFDKTHQPWMCIRIIRLRVGSVHTVSMRGVPKTGAVVAFDNNCRLDGVLGPGVSDAADGAALLPTSRQGFAAIMVRI